MIPLWPLPTVQGTLLFLDEPRTTSSTTYFYIEAPKPIVDPELVKQRQRIVTALKARLPPYWYDPKTKEWKVRT